MLRLRTNEKFSFLIYLFSAIRFVPVLAVHRVHKLSSSSLSPELRRQSLAANDLHVRRMTLWSRCFHSRCNSAFRLSNVVYLWPVIYSIQNQARSENFFSIDLLINFHFIGWESFEVTGAFNLVTRCVCNSNSDSTTIKCKKNANGFNTFLCYPFHFYSSLDFPSCSDCDFPL